MSSSKLSVAAGLLLVGAVGSEARAEEVIEGPGVSVGEGTVLHPNVGAEAGVINNVFYENTSPITSGILRVSAKFDVASAKAPDEEEIDPEAFGEDLGNEPAAPTVEFRAGGTVAYEEYLYYDNVSTPPQRNLTFDLAGHLVAYPQGTWSFIADDRLRRDVRPRHFENPTSTNRIDNLLNLSLRYQPGGRALSATLRYQNVLDIYQDTTVANRMNQQIALRTDWQWRPYTRLFADLSYGFYGPLGDAAPAGLLTKHSSNPLHFLTGVATVLSEVVTVKAHLGWGWSPYAVGQGYNAPLLGAEFGYEYAPKGRVVLEADYYFADSTNANFYRDYKFAVGLEQGIDKLLFTSSIGTYLRGYRGIDGLGAMERDDFILEGKARAQYVLTERYYATAEYIGTTVQTDYMPVVGDDPSYTRHEFMLGARAAF